MTKQQTGLRIDRVLFQRFLKLCATEKLRPGEAVENLVRKAIERGAVVDVYTDNPKPDSVGRYVHEMLFRSRLSRLKTCVELERRHLLETGTPVDDPADSEELVKELTSLARGWMSLELAKEFEIVLSDADKLWKDAEKTMVDGWINTTQTSGR